MMHFLLVGQYNVNTIMIQQFVIRMCGNDPAWSLAFEAFA